MLIITITIFGMSLYLIKQFFSATGEIEAQISADMKKEVERRLMETGERVALPLNKVTLQRGKSHAFGLGILNTLGETKNFFVKMEFAVPGHYTLDGERITEGDIVDKEFVDDKWIFTAPIMETLENNEQIVIPLTVRVHNSMSQDSRTMRDSTYVFNVCVSTDAPPDKCEKGVQSGLYTKRLYKIYVDVK